MAEGRIRSGRRKGDEAEGGGAFFAEQGHKLLVLGVWLGLAGGVVVCTAEWDRAGGLPGGLAFVLFGASIEGDLAGANLSLQPWTLALCTAMFLVSLGLSRYARRREGEKTAG